MITTMRELMVTLVASLDKPALTDLIVRQYIALYTGNGANLEIVTMAFITLLLLNIHYVYIILILICMKRYMNIFI